MADAAAAAAGETPDVDMDGDGSGSADTKQRQVTAVLIGAGSRGKTYALYAQENPDLLKIVAVAEPRDFHRSLVAKRHALPADRCFKTWEEVAKLPKLADCVIIATQDSMHVAPAVAMAKLGYNMLLEKPMAVNIEECCRIVAAVKKAGVIFATCHVLRYMPYSAKIRDLIASGTIGEVVNVQHLEPIGNWHFAHSYVRGNWRKEATSSSMLMAKCCHDVDLLRFIVGQPFDQVSSFGSLQHFRKDKKPAGAGTRCITDCSIESSCPYSAVRIYRDRVASGATGWPCSVLVDAQPTVANIEEAIRTGPYGRCVWESDNDVLDNQMVNIQFANGTTSNLTTVAYTKDVCQRHTRVFGSLGELEGDGDSRVVHHDFRSETSTVYTADPAPSGTSMQGHNGADYFLMKAFVKAVAFNDPSSVLSGPDETLESHMAVFAAEEARKTRRVINVADFVKAAMAKVEADNSATTAATATASGAGGGAGAS